MSYCTIVVRCRHSHNVLPDSQSLAPNNPFLRRATSALRALSTPQSGTRDFSSSSLPLLPQKSPTFASSADCRKQVRFGLRREKAAWTPGDEKSMTSDRLRNIPDGQFPRSGDISCSIAYVACWRRLTPLHLTATSRPTTTPAIHHLPSRARELVRVAPDSAALWKARRWRWSLLEKLVSTSFALDPDDVHPGARWVGGALSSSLYYFDPRHASCNTLSLTF